MVKRLQTLSNSESFFLFGARGTGKTTLLKKHIKQKDTLWIDLLDYEQEDIYLRNPKELFYQIETKKYERVVIDEVQKIPKLLDIVHQSMNENLKIQWIMTGSSARKLRHGAANLLAGRAFTFSLFPFSFWELKKQFDLKSALEYGTLPKVFEFKSKKNKQAFLKSYALTYLKEEIQSEALLLKIDRFKSFLEVAAQSNGKILNIHKIAQNVGIDDKTVNNYFSILEDTLIGFFLPSFHRSIRKQQRLSPKFYFFDTGVKRALDRTLSVELLPSTYAFGDVFEHFIILECFRLNEYFQKDFRFSYLRTKDQAEVDLIIERPSLPDLLIEIKSTNKTKKEHGHSVGKFLKSWDKEVLGQVWSLDKREKKINDIDFLYWKTGLEKLFS